MVSTMMKHGCKLTRFSVVLYLQELTIVTLLKSREVVEQILMETNMAIFMLRLRSRLISFIAVGYCDVPLLIICC